MDNRKPKIYRTSIRQSKMWPKRIDLHQRGKQDQGTDPTTSTNIPPPDVSFLTSGSGHNFNGGTPANFQELLQQSDGTAQSPPSGPAHAFVNLPTDKRPASVYPTKSIPVHQHSITIIAERSSHGIRWSALGGGHKSDCKRHILDTTAAA